MNKIQPDTEYDPEPEQDAIEKEWDKEATILDKKIAEIRWKREMLIDMRDEAMHPMIKASFMDVIWYLKGLEDNLIAGVE